MHIIGHQKERATLKDTLDYGNIAQAYLFTGPQSIGKSLCALEFAACLAGEPDFEPSEEKPHPFDVMVIRPLEVTKRGVTKVKNIPSESIREALSFLSQFPAGGKFRVLLIEDAHRLSETAQNVLLKTLEEPASSAVIILVTHEKGSILPTVLSRIKQVRFSFVPQEVLSREFGTEETSDIAPFFFSLGRPGMILSALSDPAAFSVERELLGGLFRLSTLTLTERLALAEKMAVHTERSVRLLEWWLPGLYQQSRQRKDRKQMVRFFELFEEIEATLRLLKTTQSNTRLLLEKLLLSV